MTHQDQVKDIEAALRELSTPERQKGLQRYFKTGKGEYAEGDCFIGVTVPDVRKVAKAAVKTIELPTIECLLDSPWHECRLCALILLDMLYKKGDAQRQEVIVSIYLNHIDSVNNWDLVDLSAPNLLGHHLLLRNRGMLYRMAESESLWQRRIAVVATFTFIRYNDFADTIAIIEKLLHTELPIHDLMQKAMGWMLREVGKRDEKVLEDFLTRWAAVMPRTMLRYAIEKMAPEERQHWMGLKGASSKSRT